MDLCQITSIKALQTDEQIDAVFKRKAYRKNFNQLTCPSSPEPELNFSPKFKLPEIPVLKSSQSSKQRTSFDNKISELIDFGLDPQVPKCYWEQTKNRKSKKNTIKITDFIKKSHQNQILSTHSLNKAFDSSEKLECFSREKISAAFSISLSREETISVRNTNAFLVLPPIITSSTDGSQNGKGNREENLKKIDKILDSCNELLGGERGGKKWKTEVPKIFHSKPKPRVSI